MKSVIYALFIFGQFSFDLVSPFQIQHNCMLWDSSCLTASAQAIVPTFAAGIPALGTERLDTMYIDSLHIHQDGYDADWDNIYLQGFGKAVIDSLSINTNSKVMRLQFHTDLSLKAHYVNKGVLLSLPITGDGEVTMNLKNVQMEFVIPFEIIKDIQGRDIMDLKGYQYWYDIKDGANVYLGNLYYGNYELSQKMHTLVQQNWKLLSIRYGRYLFDKSNDKIFNAIRNYMHSRALDTIAVY